MTANPAHGYPPHIPDEDTTETEREQLLRLIESLSDTYAPGGVAIWLSAPNRRLAGRRPCDLMGSSEWAVLHAEADRLAGGPVA